ncbi:phosphoribosylglycinamide formyltransferase [Acuticoccus sp. MNP-M23]|uniref:phosphoribosylglycinamide formyltransferase n=1 Tax=Acuticoccus sp. MNP-M23 TaxID=3072793 RepID=UPI0028162392|nr:phosphoribosylglycinamide formyltransferase [Acuticoccus sp. MNP-M23]WMS41665.1 phosphoribosylglycinamide formyltransferase [Acuticoccus sp. MNP-M23]
MMKTPIAVLFSGRGSNLKSLIDACAAPDFPATIVLAATDKPEAGGLAHAANAGIPVAVVDRKAYGDRATFEAALDKAVRASGAELICLAGFMRILSGTFVAAWVDAILNIHPSLLPAFRGLDTHARALAAGAKIAGITVHIVTEELDDGPILAQAAVAVRPDDTPETLAARTLAAEHRLYPAALAQHLMPREATDYGKTLFSPPLPDEG